MPNKATPKSLLLLAFLIIIRVFIQIGLYRHGFVSLTADEFSRGLRAAVWAQNPQFDILKDVQSVWLPFEKYINGVILTIWYDVILVPRITVFLASIVTLIAIFFFANALFKNSYVPLLSIAFLMLQPWFVWISGTPMLEMYYFACFFSGMFFIWIWLNEQKTYFWLFAGVAFFLATSLHVQSWLFINIVNLVTLPYLHQFVRQKQTQNVAKLIGFYFIGNAFIFFYGAAEYTLVGTLFAFFSKHTGLSLQYYNGYNVPTLDKIRYYPNLIINNLPFIVWPLFFIGVLKVLFERERYSKLFPLTVSLIGLTLSIVFNLLSGPPSAAPSRYALLHIIVMSLYAAYGVYVIYLWGQKANQQGVRWLVAVCVALLFAYPLWWGGRQIVNYPTTVPQDAVETGQTLFALLDDQEPPFLVEKHHWDFLGVWLASGHFDTIIFDRQDEIGRDAEHSFLNGEPQDICETIRATNVTYMALLNDDFKQNVTTLSGITPLEDVGRWTVFQVEPSLCG